VTLAASFLAWYSSLRFLARSLLLLELSHLIRLHPGVLLLPAVKRLFRDPTCRIRFATGIPSSACFNTATICSIENRFFFIANSPPFKVKFAEKLTSCLVRFS
jgi:hypothetical protein